MKKKVLFVCMGNICRSPAAEGIMTKLIKDMGFENKIEVDSAGTLDFHHGEPADPRMSKHASKRGYKLTSLSRQFNPAIDFDEFDYIITMDNNNYEDILSLDKKNKYGHKVHKIAEFFINNGYDEVPDPYLGSSDSFEIVLDLLEEGNKNLFENIRNYIESESD